MKNSFPFSFHDGKVFILASYSHIEHLPQRDFQPAAERFTFRLKLRWEAWVFSEEHCNLMELEEGHSVTNVHFPKTACTVFLDTFQPINIFSDSVKLTAPLFTDTS